MDVMKTQINDLHPAYETPNISIFIFPAIDALRTSDKDTGEEWPEDWGGNK